MYSWNVLLQKILQYTWDFLLKMACKVVHTGNSCSFWSLLPLPIYAQCKQTKNQRAVATGMECQSESSTLPGTQELALLFLPSWTSEWSAQAWIDLENPNFHPYSMYLPLFPIWSLVCRARQAQFMPIFNGPSYFNISRYENPQLCSTVYIHLGNQFLPCHATSQDHASLSHYPHAYFRQLLSINKSTGGLI